MPAGVGGYRVGDETGGLFLKKTGEMGRLAVSLPASLSSVETPFLKKDAITPCYILTSKDSELESTNKREQVSFIFLSQCYLT